MMWTVFSKEVKELMRDRKHLLVTILLPILITPLMMYAVGALQAKAVMDSEAEVLSYMLIQDVELPGFTQALLEDDLLESVAGLDLQSATNAIKNETLDLLIFMTGSYKQTTIDVTYKQTGLTDSKLERIEDITSQLNAELVAENLFHYGVKNDGVEKFLNPILVTSNNAATKQESLGQALGGFLPFLIIIWILSSAIAISSDLVAGEKERGTLETLIISPVSLLSMISGKWLAIALTAWMAGVLTLLSLWGSAMVLAGMIDADIMEDLLTALSPAALVSGIIITLPTAGLVAAVFLVSGSVAQSFKEAQSYASGIMMLFFIPLFATISGTIDLSIKTSLIPIMNTSLAFTEILKGTMDMRFIVPIVISNSLVIFAVLAGAVALYKSERVLARE